jgi:cyclic dehypoxanthinyl futalosine synthase
MKPRSRHAAGAREGLLTEDGRLVLAGISYLNSRPIQDALDQAPYAARFHLDRMVPSEAARRVAEGEAALGLIPVAAAATHGGLRFVRGIAIGARGPVRSVLVVSHKPFDRVSTVLLDASSRTSVVLARLVLGRLRRSEPRWAQRRYPLRLETLPDDTAAVIIGDPALRIRESFAHVIDLGQAWFEWTGEPFVFAGWAGDPALLSRVGFTRHDEELLRDGLSTGLDMRRAIAQSSGFDEASAYAYLTEAVRYTFDEPERRGLALFYAKAAAHGLLPKAEPLFFDDPAPQTRRSLDTVLQRAADGERISGADAVRLGDEASIFDLGVAAEQVRKRKHPAGVVTYIVDRNVNYTNVCTTSCRFCAFYRPVGHPEGYVLSRDELAVKLREVCEAGGVQILLQGGLNPDLPLTWYEDLFRWIKAEFRLGLHALSPEEILHIARLEELRIEEVLTRLRAAGLDSVPGGGAEILVDRVRRRIAKAKCTSDEWLEVMRACHSMDLRSSATMMYGTTDTTQDRVLHLLKVRDLQDEMHGFTAFFCWDYRHEEGTRLAPGDHGTGLYLRTQALARLVLDNVDHVGASWVTQGPDVGEIALSFGADDFGSVMFEENVVSSAGTTYRIDAGSIERRIHAAGFRAARRNVLYDWLTPPS